MKNKVQQNKAARNFRSKGYIVAYALIAATIAVTVLFGMVIFVNSGQKRSLDEVARQQAIQVAESGIYYYSWYLAHNLDGKNAQQIKVFWQSAAPVGVAEPYVQEVANFEGDAIGRYEVEVLPPDPDSTIVIVKSTGWTYRHPTIKRSIQVRFRRPSWSEYSVLGNDVMRFGEGTTTYGKVHSNKGIHFDGVATNVVSSAVSTYYDDDYDVKSVKPGVWTSQPDEEAVFLAGKEYPVPLIDFNGVTSDLAYMRSEAQSGGLYFGEAVYTEEICSWRVGWRWCGGNWGCQVCRTEEYPIFGYHVTLRTDDKIEVRMVFDYQGDNTHEPKTYKITDEGDPVVYDMPANGLAFFNKHVWVDGQIDTAKLTIVSADLDSSLDTDIYINDNILYTNKDGRDILGLIAENNISVGLFSANDLEIDAALLAQKGRVGRDYYTYSQSSAFYKRDSITVWGSIATNGRYGFAWTDGTGYNIRNIYFDNNLLYYPPPFFPTGSVYNLDLWEEL